MASIRVTGIEQVYEKLGRLEGGKYLRKPMEESLALIQGRAATYPPPPAGYHVEFVSERQRRGFFAKLRDGEITVPYHRTGKLGQKWTKRIETGSEGISGIVGNNMDYGPWVQSVDEIGSQGPQAQVHQGRWETDEQIVTATRPRVLQIFQQAIAALLGR